MKYFLHLSYKGTHYHGWQRQPNHHSVQEELETQLEQMLGYKVNCIGCGRTDSGVHASQFFCHIIVDESFDYDPVYRLNKMLPDDISIRDCIEVPRDAHAQHNAISRTYEYYFHTRKNALLSELSSWYPAEDLKTSVLAELLPLLCGRHDFSSFCKQPGLYPDTHCTLSEVDFRVHPGGERFCLRFTADRFLRGMVRILVGQLMEAAYGRLSQEGFEKALGAKKAFQHFNMAYPQGLYLAGVRYEFLEVENQVSEYIAFKSK